MFLVAIEVFSAILISGGLGDGDGFTDDLLASIEVLDTNGIYLCSLPDLPGPRYSHTLVGLTSCGGWTYSEYGGPFINTCDTFSSGQWSQSHQLLYARSGPTSWSVDNQVYIIGGSNSHDAFEKESDKTTEKLSLDSSTTTESFTLKYERTYVKNKKIIASNDILNLLVSPAVVPQMTIN